MADVSTTMQMPPDFLQPYYQALAERGMQMGNLGFTPYDQNRVAEWNPQQDAAAQMIQTRALAGSPEMSQASNFAMNTMNGQNNVQSGTNPYAGSNPYLNNAINQAQNDVTSRIDSKFNGNAFGGTAHQQTLGRELGNVASNMRMQDYGMQQNLAEQGLNRNMNAQQFNMGQRMGAMQFAPTLAQNDYNDASQLMNLGLGIQGHNQNIANANYGEFMRQQEYPSQQLNWMQMGLNPSTQAFRNTTSTNPSNQGANPWATAAGAVGTGAGLYNLFSGGW